MKTTAIRIGPEDHGRAMSLADFEHAKVKEGYLYELERGVIVVSDVPNLPHAAQVIAARRQLAAYDLAHPGRIYGVFAGNECKILISEDESERHPDIAVYMTEPTSEDSGVWLNWVPEIVVEVVSAQSHERDYNTKRKEYLRFGVSEYWILDLVKSELLVHRRAGDRWRKSKVPAGKLYTTPLLPGLEFDCGRVFEAAR